MPEIKNTFTQGKMNKDLDERIVPNGEYRDAMNIQVSTSDSSDVGAIENILGNKNLMAGQELGDSAYCVGTVADEKNNALYWLIAGPIYAGLNDVVNKDYIVQYKDGNINPVVVDIYRVRTNYGAHDSAANQLVVATLDSQGNTIPGLELIEVGMVAQFDNSLAQVSYFGNNPVTNVSAPDSFGNITVTLQNNFNVPVLSGSDQQSSSFIFSKPDNKRVLNFIPGQLITGINILNDFLFWTDNQYEPKKIHIQRCLDGTVGFNNNTRLIVPDRDITISSNILLQEKHVTLIRKAPTVPLLVNPTFDIPTIATAQFDFGQGTQTLYEVGDLITVDFSNFQFGSQFETSDEVRFLEVGSGGELPGDHQVRTKVISKISSTEYKLEITSIATTTDNGSANYNVEQVPTKDPLFEKKFPRFSYRYKYQDGEYSTFAPFTDVVFKAGRFDYDSNLAYNKGMQNYIKSLELRRFLPYDLPEDVVQVDLLYKESNSPTVYVVDKIKYKDGVGDIEVDGNTGLNNWQANLYNVTTDLIYSVVPSNQILRPYDNVPRAALGQEITGNRIVFANYLQNYDLDTKPLLESDNATRYDLNFAKNALVEYTLDFPNNDTEQVEYIKTDYDYGTYSGLYSLKSIRNYQVGLTYLDEYGRETPVFSNSESTFFIPKKQAEFKTKIKTRIKTPPPIWAKGFKFYVKETANEYYNLAMDRVYRAEDGNLWLSFPSSERNKIDEETFLILKKQVDTNSVVEELAKYKVIAIENEAPDFIKTEILTAGESSPTDTETLLSTVAPVVGSDFFEIDEDTWVGGNNAKLIDITEKLSLAFVRDGFFSKTYDVVNLSYGNAGGVAGNGVYKITLDRPIETNDQWIYPNFPTVVSNNLPDFNNNLVLKVYKHVIENKPEFEGRFFVKINGDSVTEDRLIGAVSSETQYQVDARMNAYFLLDQQNAWFGGGSNTTGVNKSDSVAKWENNLDFNNPEDDITDSEWFIDGAYYPMIHKERSGAVGTSFHITEHSAQDPFTPTLSNPFPPPFVDDGTQAGGWGRAIQQETSGAMRWYIELAHSQLKPDMSDNQSFIGERVGNQAVPGDINFEDINENYIWEVGSASNPDHQSESPIVNAMRVDGLFRFTGDTNPDPVYGTSSQIYKITEVKKIRRYNHTRWGRRNGSLFGPASLHEIWRTAHSDPYYLNSDWDNNTYVDFKEAWERFMRADNRRIVYRLYIDKDPTTSSSFNPIERATIQTNSGSTNGAEDDVAIGIEFISPRTVENRPLISDNPAMWETEPKENIDLDLYHEASQVYPTKLTAENNELYVPKGSIVEFLSPNANTNLALYKGYTNTDVDTTVVGWFDHDGNNPGDLIALSHEIDTTNISAQFDVLKFTRHDNSYVTLRFADLQKIGTYPASTYVYRIETDVSQNEVGLSWYNAFSFSNGVESDRLRDIFNEVKLDKGPIVSTTLDTIYKEERRSSGLIFSGIYNTNSGINSLNQFIQAEKITKDLNPTYGSIQKLFSRQTDLIALCEDRVVRILANKDAIFNADGNPQLTANQNVLGQTMPFAGDYGISKNPESFAVDNYRAYFTDKQRSAVLRLSMDGLTNISDYGMGDWFGDNLQNYPKLVGSYDTDKRNYNLTLSEANIRTGHKSTTLTYSEDVRGWVSFKSFIPEQGISMNNDYFTFKNGYIYLHHQEDVDRNTFYDDFTPSSVDVLLNSESGSVKNYQTINYEGSDSKITQEILPPGINSNEYEGYKRLISKEGWFVEDITTNKQKGHIVEFVEKEGKWFNYIKGNFVSTNEDIKTSEFSYQGIGRATSVPTPIFGCTDTQALNFDPDANIDDGSCMYPTTDCCDQKANNYNANANICDNTLCTYDDTWNCDTVNGGVILVTDGTGAYSDYATAVANCPTCIGQPGCTDPNYQEYDPAAVCDDGSCLTLATYGCTDGTIGAPFHPDVHGLCIDGTAPHPTTGKCDPNNGYVLCNYDPLATIDDGSCIMPYFGCIDPSADNYDPCASFTDGSCTYTVSGCTDPNAVNYDPLATTDDGSCCYNLGCMDTQATNYDPNACFDDGSSCVPVIFGCTDTVAANYSAAAQAEDGSCIYIGCADPTLNAYGWLYNHGHPQNTSSHSGTNTLPRFIDSATHTHSFTNQTNYGTGINNGGLFGGQTFTYSLNGSMTGNDGITYPANTFPVVSDPAICNQIETFGQLLGTW